MTKFAPWIAGAALIAVPFVYHAPYPLHLVYALLLGASVVLAGGIESMTHVPMTGHRYRPNPTLIDRYPDVYLRTGLVAENHARDYGISRDEQDAFALRSHDRAAAAIDAGRFRDEIVAVQGVDVDEGPDRKSTRLNSSHSQQSRMPSSA